MFLKILIAILLIINNSYANDDEFNELLSKLEKKHHVIIGVSVGTKDKDTQFHYNDDYHFKMASTVKLPLAVLFLSNIEQKRINFDQLIEIKPSDLVPGSGMLGYFVLHPGFKISYRNLFEPMLTISDNTATDLIFDKVGGPQALRTFLTNHKLNNIWVARNIKQLFFDARNYEQFIAYPLRNLKWWNDQWQVIKNNPDKYWKTSRQYHNDFRDTTTSYDMNNLLNKLMKDQIIQPNSFEYLFDVMTRNSTSNDKIRKYIPQNIIIADKTGGWDNATHIYRGDIGYIKTNDRLISFVIYIEGIKQPNKNEHFSEIIALIGKIIYERFGK